MYIRRKVFSVAVDQATGEEKLFSVNEVISEESYQRMFAEAEEEEPKKSHRVAKGAATGAAATVGAAGVGAAGVYGAGKISNRLAGRRIKRAVEEKNAIMKEAAEKASAEAKKYAGDRMRGVRADRVHNAVNTGINRSKNVKIADAGKIEKGLAALQRGGASATKWVKSNPKLAASIAAGTLATGAAIGAGTGALTGKKKSEK
jgi:hypothetical protein